MRNSSEEGSSTPGAASVTSTAPWSNSLTSTEAAGEQCFPRLEFRKVAVGEFTNHFRTCFSGDWDVHWGCGKLTHSQLSDAYASRLARAYVLGAAGHKVHGGGGCQRPGVLALRRAGPGDVQRPSNGVGEKGEGGAERARNFWGGVPPLVRFRGRMGWGCRLV